MEKQAEGEIQDKGKRQRAVPKFGSFKPKPTAASEPDPDARPASKETGARPEDDDRHEGGRRHRHSGRDEFRRVRDREPRRSDRERQRHRNAENERETERERRLERERDGRREDHRDGREHADRKVASGPTDDLFAIDKHGDPLIVQYGSNDRAKVPIYHRFGPGRIIGSPGYLTIHRDGAREQFSIRLPGEGAASGSAFRDKALVAEAGRRKSRRVRPSPSVQPPLPAPEDFISLARSTKRKLDADDFSDHDTIPDYRSIYGQARRRSASSSSSSSSSSRSPSPPYALPAPSIGKFSAAKSRSVELTDHLKSNPSDTPAWLELISLQEPLFREDRLRLRTTSDGHPHRRTADEVRSLAELKLALYADALSHAASPRDRERLLLGLMREGARAWDPGKLARKWDELAAAGGQTKGGVDGRAKLSLGVVLGGGTVLGGARYESFALWRARLDFEMGRVDRFGVAEVRGLITRELHALLERLRVSEGQKAQQQQKNGEGEDTELLCERTVYVFLRLTRLLFDAGFSELAVAAWQAMLEMVFLRPQGLEDNPEPALRAFSAFWESELARIGEEGAKGWKHFVETGDTMVEPPDAREDRPSEVPRGAADPLQAWAAVELQGLQKARMPARTLDEGTEDDPFRVVLFSDIEGLLLWFPSQVLPLVKPLLVDAFIVFSGLPPAGISGERFAAMLSDPFVAPKGQGLDFGSSRPDAGTTLDLSVRTPDFSQQGGSMALSSELLFSGNGWFRYLEKWSNTHGSGDKQVEPSWVLRTLRVLVKDCGIEALAEYYLAMEWLNEPAGARKVAKGLLKQYSSSTRLYNAYALVEWANQNPDVSHKVLSSATGLGLPASSGDGQLLWNTWAWIHLEAGEKKTALSRLCSSVDRGAEGLAPSPALLLKARSRISTARDYSLSSQQLSDAARFAESLMLVEYLSAEGCQEPTSGAQGNITAALTSVDNFSRELEARTLAQSQHHERLLQAAARLLYHHAAHGPYRPTYVRLQLERFIHFFPHNTIFLSLFAWTQPPLRIDDPVRAIIQQSLSKSDDTDDYDNQYRHGCLSTHRLAIRHEARSGTAHSVRAAFEDALSPASSSSSSSSCCCCCSCCRNSVELWTRYVRFCADSVELRGKAKEVFHRAIAACPWAKEVYMAAFDGLAAQLGAAELRSVVNTMVSKGLRVHVDLDEFLEGWKQERGADPLRRKGVMG